MEQPWNQQREGGGFAMGVSSCHAADLDQQATTDPCEVVDGALLMEDLPSSDLLLDGDDVDRQLSHVIRSLEAEIGGGGGDEAAAMMADEAGDGLERIEDLLSDGMDGYDYEQGASSFGYWPQVVSSSILAGGQHDEAEGWCVCTNTDGYEGGGVLGYDTAVDHQYYYCCAEGPAEHMYLPLWE